MYILNIYLYIKRKVDGGHKKNLKKEKDVG